MLLRTQRLSFHAVWTLYLVSQGFAGPSVIYKNTSSTAGTSNSRSPLFPSFNETTSRPTTYGAETPTYSTSSSSSSSSSTDAGVSVHVGSFIALGLGLSAPPETSTTKPAQSLNRSAPLFWSTPPTNTSKNASTGLYPTRTTNVTLSTGSSSSNTSLERCWQDWQGYWAGNSTVYEIVTYETGYIWTWTTSIITGPVTTVMHTVETSVTISGGAFAIATEVVTTTRADEITLFTPFATTEIISTHNVTDTRAITKDPNATPSCRLPTSAFSQCQSAWDTWINNQISIPELTVAEIWETKSMPQSVVSALISTMLAYGNSVDKPAPSCTQATMASSACTSLIDVYVTGERQALSDLVQGTSSNGKYPYISSGYIATSYANNGTFTTEWNWPTSAPLGPGCNVGCGRCAITGNSVDLLYWPPATNNLSRTNDALMTTVAFGTTLTSPTVYIAFSEVYASDACKGLGSTYYNTIVPVSRVEDLSSQWGRLEGTMDGAHDLGPSIYNGDKVYISTAPFNIHDLYQQPVPMSIYSSQPWCATWAYYGRNATFNGDSRIVAWSCPNSRAYEPILVLPSSLLVDIDPAWSTCSADLRGYYDPPSALTPASAPAQPTEPIGSSPSATPAQSPPSAAASTTALDPVVTAIPSSAPSAVMPTLSFKFDPLPSASLDPSLSSSEVPYQYWGTADRGAAPPPPPPQASNPGDPEVGSASLPSQTSGSQNALSVLIPILSSALPSDPSGDPSASAPGRPGSPGTSDRPGDSSESNGVALQTIAPSLVISFDRDKQLHTVQHGSSSNVAIIDHSVTLSVGGSDTTIDGQRISLASNGLTGDSQFFSWPVPLTLTGASDSSQPSAVPLEVALITGSSGNPAMTAVQYSGGDAAVIDSSITLSPGGAGTVIDGISISLGSNGIVRDGTSQLWQTVTTMSAAGESQAPTIEVIVDPSASTGGGFIAVHGPDQSIVVIDESFTLALGGPGTVINGVSMSMASSGVLVDGTLDPWSTVATTREQQSEVTVVSKTTQTIFASTAEAETVPGAKSNSPTIIATAAPESLGTSKTMPHALLLMSAILCVLAI